MQSSSDSLQPTILVVDDDEILRLRLLKAFERRGMRVFCAAGVEEATALTEKYQPDLAVVDLKMADGSGMELLKRIRARSPRTRVVVMTGYGNITNAVEAIKLGALNYVSKPADADQLLAAFNTNVPLQDPIQYTPPSLAEAEWEHIQRVLAECGGNISAAARLLDIPRRTLQRKLKKMAP
jgi:two-component system response regulator RegA